MIRSWKTSLLGVAVLVIAAVTVWQDPSRWNDKQVVALYALGTGLLAAKDGNVTGGGDAGLKPQDRPKS